MPFARLIVRNIEVLKINGSPVGTLFHLKIFKGIKVIMGKVGAILIGVLRVFFYTD